MSKKAAAAAPAAGNATLACGNAECRKALAPPLLQCSKCKGEAYCCKACQVPPAPTHAQREVRALTRPLPVPPPPPDCRVEGRAQAQMRCARAGRGGGTAARACTGLSVRAHALNGGLVVHAQVRLAAISAAERAVPALLLVLRSSAGSPCGRTACVYDIAKKRCCSTLQSTAGRRLLDGAAWQRACARSRSGRSRRNECDEVAQG